MRMRNRGRKRVYAIFNVKFPDISPNNLDLCMDATRMDFRNQSFDICIDKGTYDALAVK
jgi:hypothetical protein